MIDKINLIKFVFSLNEAQFGLACLLHIINPCTGSWCLLPREQEDLVEAPERLRLGALPTSTIDFSSIRTHVLLLHTNHVF